MVPTGVAAGRRPGPPASGWLASAVDDHPTPVTTTAGSRRAAIRFGLGALAAQTSDGSAAGSHEQLGLLVASCREAERAGLDSVWLSEHHFADDGYLPSPLVVMAAVARETSRVTLATNVALAPLYHPLRLAEDAAVLDHLCAGRLMLGLGLGYRPAEFAGLGVPRGERGRRLEACLATLRSAWSGGPVAGADGATVRVFPRPFQEAGPPVLLGAFAEAGVRRAGLLADGWIGPTMAQPGLLRARLAWLADDGAFDHPFHVALTFGAFVAAADAWELAGPGVRRVEGQYRRWMVEAADGPAVGPGPDGADLASAPPGHLLIGRPDQVAGRLGPWCDVLAELPPTVTCHVTVRLNYPGVPAGAQLEAVRLFGEEVVPRLRAGTVR